MMIATEMEEIEINQLVEKVKHEFSNPEMFYDIAKRYETLKNFGDAYFFYWLANNHQYPCLEELERTLQQHPHFNLISKAKHLNLAVRLSVIDSLTAIGDNSVLPVLIGFLNDEVWQVRYRALTSLETIRNTFAAEYIHQIIKDPEEVVRQHAAICLGNLHHQKSIPCLFEMLQDQDAVVRQLTIRALGHFEPTFEIIEELKRMLHDRDAFTRKSARETLKKFQQSTDYPPHSNELPIHPF